MKFATVYKPCRVDGVSFEDSPSLTQSQFQESTDINALIRRALSGDMSVFGRPEYLDVLGAPESFHEAANKTAFARTVWEGLPDEVRATYGSPEALLLDFDRKAAALAKANVEAAAKFTAGKDSQKAAPSVSSTETPVPSKT